MRSYTKLLLRLRTGGFNVYRGWFSGMHVCIVRNVSLPAMMAV
jgi:hypothetical protein